MQDRIGSFYGKIGSFANWYLTNRWGCGTYIDIAPRRAGSPDVFGDIAGERKQNMPEIADYHEDFYIKYEEIHFSPMHEFHVHTTFDELLIVKNGTSACITEAQFVHMRGSYGIYYPTGVPHQQINDLSGPYQRYCIRYPREMIADILPPDRQPHGFFAVELSPKTLEKLCLYARTLTDQAETAVSPKLLCERKCLIALIVNELQDCRTAQQSRIERQSSSQSTLVGNVCRYIEDHIAGDTSIDALAETFYVSRAKLVRVFKQVIGMTIWEYVQVIRMSRARKMLVEGRPLAEIAEACGFFDASYFVKVFRKSMDMTPGEYRARAQASEPEP